MERDIDAVIAILRRAYPSIAVEQLAVAHPGADDDGLWVFRLSPGHRQVQVESPAGAVPFLIESADISAATAHTVQEAVGLVATRLGLGTEGS